MRNVIVELVMVRIPKRKRRRENILKVFQNLQRARLKMKRQQNPQQL